MLEFEPGSPESPAPAESSSVGNRWQNVRLGRLSLAFACFAAVTGASLLVGGKGGPIVWFHPTYSMTFGPIVLIGWALSGWLTVNAFRSPALDAVDAADKLALRYARSTDSGDSRPPLA